MAPLGNHCLTILVEKTFLLQTTFQHISVNSYPMTLHHCEQPGSISSITLTQGVRGSCQVPPKPSFLQDKPAWVPQPLLTWQVHHHDSSLLNSFQFFLCLSCAQETKTSYSM